MRINLISIPLYFIIFATGAAGLIYQVTWQKYLSRLLGSDSMAIAIILAAFLGGLSFGYYLCGRFTTRIKNHFKAYALLEGIIGLWCLGFPTIFKTVHSLTQHWSFATPFIIIGQGFLCSALLMGIPTICMGGTIPFLTRGISKNVVEATNVHAKVYAVNTAGAFLGTLVAGFYLIPIYGMPLTVMGTAVVNLIAFLFFYVIAHVKKQKGSSYPEQDIIIGPVLSDTTAPPRFSPFRLYLIAFLSGFYVMTLENALIRITNISMGSSSYSFSMIVSVFILSIAIGSYGVSKFKQMPRYLLFINQITITLLLLGIYISLDMWPYCAHIIRIAFQSNIVGFWGYYSYIFLALTLLLVLPVSFMGATVPIAFHELKRDLENVGKHSGILFSWNTIGNLLGSLIGGIAFYYFLNNAEVFLTAVLLAAVSSCLASWCLSKRYFLLPAILAIIIILSTVFTPFYSQKYFMSGTFRIRKPLEFSLSGPGSFFEKYTGKHELKFYKDGPTATVAVVESLDQHPRFNQKSAAIVINGKPDSSTIGDIYTLKLSAHIPALLAKKRENIMVIGIGTGVTAGELTLYPDVETIDIAEISPTVCEALPYFEKSTHRVHQDPRVRIHIGDAFRILSRSDKQWDIIISEPSNPWMTGVDLLFTREFYQLVRQHLTEDGILLQWVQVYAASQVMVEMIVNTLQQEFRQLRVFMANSGDLLIVASNRDFSIEDLDRASKIFNSHDPVKASLETINMTSFNSILLREIWTPSYIADKFSGLGIQTMDNPRLHYIAGKSFFTGEHVPIEYFFSPESSPYLYEFLLVKNEKQWTNFVFSKEIFNSFLLSTLDKVTGKPLPMTAALKLKAYLSNPECFSLSEMEKAKLKIHLIPFVTGRLQEEKDWDKIGLGDSSYRKKVERLLSHIRQFRNWIAAYPIDGLKKLLQEGITEAKDVNEKNWCVLQLALILADERAEKEAIEAILDQAIKGNDNKIILKEQDKILWETILHLLRSIHQTAKSESYEHGAVELFLKENYSKYIKTIEKAEEWLNDLKVDPQELREHGLKGKKRLVEQFDAYVRLYSISSVKEKKRLLKKMKRIVACTYQPEYHNMGKVNDEQFKQDATSYMRLAYLMDRVGLDTEYYKKEIQRILHRLDDHMITRGSHQQMVFHVYYKHFGFQEPIDLAKGYCKGIITRRKNPFLFSDYETYQFTHEIFVAYDYGNKRDADFFHEEEKKYIRRALDILANHYIEIGNVDIVAELVSCIRYLNFVDMKVYQDGLELILTSQNKDGGWDRYSRERKVYGNYLKQGVFLHTTSVVIKALTIAFHKEWN